MKFMNGEKLILESDNKNLILTTHRIRFIQKLGFGKTEVISIMLENLDGCKFRYIGKKHFLIIAFLSFVTGLTLEVLRPSNNEIFITGLIISLIFYILYYITRKAVISLYAGELTMNVLVKRMGIEKVTDFIDEVEKAKNDRMSIIFSNK